MQFEKIVLLDKTLMSEEFISKLNDYSKILIKNTKIDPLNQNEIQERIGDADCVLLSRRTPINKETLSICQNIKLICICGTSSTCIDVEECAKKNIIITNVHDYADEGVVERIFSQLFVLIRGLGKYQRKDLPTELCGKTIGIIGLGAIGKLLADAALGFKMNVLYNSRTRNPEYEKKGIKFTEKRELLEKSDIITLQTPKNVNIINKDEFSVMKEKILINNTLGRAFNEEDFKERIKLPNNYMIMDAATGFGANFQNIDRVIYSDYFSRVTVEGIQRLNQKTLDNIKTYFNNRN